MMINEILRKIHILIDIIIDDPGVHISRSYFIPSVFWE